MFGSGAVALVYEILWMRRFATVFGATTPAVAATLAAIFLGFTVGSVVIGARASRTQRPLRAYGWLEMGAGLGALVVEPLLKCYDYLYPSLYQALAGSSAGLAVIKTALTMAALFLPTFFLGGTLPMLGQFVSEADDRRRLGVSAGGLYAANTFGAAVGALSVPFLLLPNLGAHASYATCIGANAMIGAIAWWLQSRRETPVAQMSLPLAPAAGAKRLERARLAGQPKSAGKSNSEAFQTAVSSRVLAGLAMLSGALIFVLEVVWSRMFAQVHENSIYSFSVVLAVLLVGLAGGAALARQGLRLGGAPMRLLGLAWLAGGVVVFVTPHLFFWLTDGLSYLKGHGGWTSYGLRIVWFALPTVLLPSLLAGIVLPLLMELAGQSPSQTAGRALGGLLGFNTFGAISGSLLAAYALPAWLGLWGTVLAAGLAMLLAGEFCLGLQRRAGKAILRRTVLCGLAAACFVLWNPLSVPRTRLQADQGEKLLTLTEGSHGIVAVVERADSRRIKLNNYYVLGGTASTGDERLQAHLPLLLHPAPKRVAFLGLGTGISAGAALLHPVERITAVELVPEVIAVAKNYFAAENLQIVGSPRTEMVSEDARIFLHNPARHFDVIVGDLMVPWRSGEASLYSADHFSAVRRALAQGGIFCQWLPMFQLSEEEFNIVAATFLDVFPSTTLWRGDFAPDQPAIALIGQRDESAIDPAVVERRIRELKSDPSNPQLLHSAGLWMFLGGALDPKEDRFIRARRNHENKPWLEILGPLNHAGSSRGAVPLFVGRSLESFLATLRARPIAGTPLARLDTNCLQWRDAGAKLGTVSILTQEGRQREAEALLKEAISALPSEIRSAFGGNGP